MDYQMNEYLNKIRASKMKVENDFESSSIPSIIIPSSSSSLLQQPSQPSQPSQYSKNILQQTRYDSEFYVYEVFFL